MWAWDAYQQQWIEMDFGSKVVLVKFVPDGLLAVAEHGAALFEGRSAMWLTRLDAPAETLATGDGQKLS